MIFGLIMLSAGWFMLGVIARDIWVHEGRYAVRYGDRGDAVTLRKYWTKRVADNRAQRINEVAERFHDKNRAWVE